MHRRFVALSLLAAVVAAPGALGQGVSLVCRSGQPVPADEPGLVFGNSLQPTTAWANAVMNGRGDIAFVTRVVLPNQSQANGVFLRNELGLRMLFRSGVGAAWLPQGQTVASSVGQPQLDEAGNLWIEVRSSNQQPYVVKYGIDGTVTAAPNGAGSGFAPQLNPFSGELIEWRSQPFQQLIGNDPTEMGLLYPGTPVFDNLPPQALNPAPSWPYQVNSSRFIACGVFYNAGLQGFAVAVGYPDHLVSLINTNTNSPLPPEAGPGARVSVMWLPWLNERNRYVYRLDLSGTSWASVIFYGDGTDANVLMRHGQAAPGFAAGATLLLPSGLGAVPNVQARVNNRGEFLVAGRVIGVPGVTGSVYWTGREGSMAPVLKGNVTEAVNAPGVRPLLQFTEDDQSSTGLAFNDLGQIAFTDGRGASPPAPVFGYDPVRGLIVFARPNVDLEIAPGVVKRVTRTNLVGPWFAYRNYASGLSQRGRLCFSLDFQDNTGALVESTLRCDADITGDGFIDFFDVDAYLEAFDTGAAIADFNGDGFIDFFDVDGFTAAFEAGC